MASPRPTEGPPQAAPQSRKPVRPPGPPPVDCSIARCVALTFDDGPGAHTERLLGMLRARNARATFFVLGQNVGLYPQALRRAVVDGHEIANHSWSHPNLTGLPADRVRTEVGRTQRAILLASGRPSLLFRPPYGATDATVGRASGLPQIMWSVDTLDWMHRDRARVARVAIGQTRPGGIVLFHDIHKTTVDAIPEVLTGLSRRGYRFVTVSELFRGKPPLRPGVRYTERDPQTPTPAPTRTATARPVRHG
ncbi:hydrolase [Actinomadura craniellae]|uniref:Hydrolase n=1 Tax=Actinomadura craniellae TaxID=2231787 RepID=A0A365H6B1_9ACTN|nr:hydrolase [Actinomadura craniellae]